MGFLEAITGRVSEIDSEEAESELEPILIDDEAVEAAFVLYRDMMIFTNRRLVLVDKQGFTGNKVSYESVPYDSIYRFEVETAGTFDMDAELTLWIRGREDPFYQELSKKIDAGKVNRLIAEHVL
jgi:hypothetical protein